MKGQLNPPLKVGDNIMCFHMEHETTVPPGTKGVVTKVQRDPFEPNEDDVIISVNWENGSQLAIISSVDLWDTPENLKNRKKRVQEVEISKKSITEVDEFERSKSLLKNIDVFKHFKLAPT